MEQGWVIVAKGGQGWLRVGECGQGQARTGAATVRHRNEGIDEQVDPHCCGGTLNITAVGSQTRSERPEQVRNDPN